MHICWCARRGALPFREALQFPTGSPHAAQRPARGARLRATLLRVHRRDESLKHPDVRDVYRPAHVPVSSCSIQHCFCLNDCRLKKTGKELAPRARPPQAPFWALSYFGMAGTTALQDLLAEVAGRRREAPDTAARIRGLARARRAAAGAWRGGACPCGTDDGGYSDGADVESRCCSRGRRHRGTCACARAAAAADAANSGPIGRVLGSPL